MTKEAKKYSIEKASYNLRQVKWIDKQRVQHAVLSLLRLTAYLALYASTFLITYIIFQNCISAGIEKLFDNLENTISLGAIFATFGSALVSVCSLFCSSQQQKFAENLNILQTNLLENADWKRWPFLKRHRRKKIGLKCFEYSLANPTITFRYKNKDLCFHIPSTSEDFSDLPIIGPYLMLLFYSKKYWNTYPDAQEELMLWDCLIALYRNILKYKINKLLVLVGGFFVANSILFSFGYYRISAILSSFF